MDTPIAVDVPKIMKRVLWGYVHTFVAIVVMCAVLFLIGLIFVRFGGVRVMIVMLESSLVFALAVGLFSELIVTTVFAGVIADPLKYPSFTQSAEELSHDLNMRVPRLYILKMGLPNAAAFGLGFFGQYAVGITPEIYELLSPTELKGVLAHEFAHIRSRDLIVMIAASIITGFAQKLAGTLLQGKTLLGNSPIAQGLGYVVKALSELLKVVRGILSQEREFQADALGAKYMRQVDPLIDALKKLADSRKKDPAKEDSEEKEEEPTVLDGVTISHPKMKYRLDALNELRLPQPELQPAS
jgi:heat shock protein HtpX